MHLAAYFWVGNIVSVLHECPTPKKWFLCHVVDDFIPENNNKLPKIFVAIYFCNSISLEELVPVTVSQQELSFSGR